MSKKNKKITKKKIKKIKLSIDSSTVISKIKYFIDIIQSTILSIQKNKTLDIISSNNLYNTTIKLESLFDNLIKLSDNINTANVEQINKHLNEIYIELKNVVIQMGTDKLEDMLYFVFPNYKNYIDNHDKLNILLKYAHPISCVVLPWKNTKIKPKPILKNRIVEDYMIVENSESLECFDLARTSNNFQTKVYGIKICFQDIQNEKTIIVKAMIDDLNITCLSNDFILNKIDNLKKNKPNETSFKLKDFDRFINSLTLKLLLIYSEKELYHKYQGYVNQNKLFKETTISSLIKDFINCELYKQRNIICQILIKFDDPEFQYLSYLLYDLLSNETNGNIDTQEQTLLYDSFPWNVKKYFRNAMNNTIKYTKTLSNFDTNNIPIEQQICMLKASDNVKEKAMLKLKEVKAKSEDSGSKARQYLDGLLKIPFGIYKKEELLNSMKLVNNDFNKIVNHLNSINEFSIDVKNKYPNIEILKYCDTIKNQYIPKIKQLNIDNLIKIYLNNKREGLVSNICYINNILKINGVKNHRLCHSGKKNNYMKENIKLTIEKFKDNSKIINSLIVKYKNIYSFFDVKVIEDLLKNIYLNWESVNKSIDIIDNKLDEAVHGHKLAKRQVKRIIGQWITGEQGGYCFGFEGPPGVGKTSLAKKGLANCLTDANGNTRPFGFIALGGASNGSTLSGHNYTYVGSTWGKIVDILMQTKCMNPIIFIDELDKISNTEHGKEIVGILTHLVDSTQNKSFQDKYFSGIDLDLSKILFIFSYNNPALIDRILLDRIHRVKFNHLSINDKLVIVKDYILPEIYKKMNLHDCIHFTDDIIKHLIDTYTNESGVRKLKELLFEIISEINLNILQNQKYDIELPIKLTNEDIELIYLKDKLKIIHKKIHNTPKVGIMNGLWANSLGMGGIIPIECNYFPSNSFLDFKLTGLQGDVMKESMNVAKTLAWKLTNKQKQKSVHKEFKEQGIHIHCPEGSIPKDGPSAGTAITIAIYSLLNKKKINNKFAITGEINLQGRISAIGGLKLKILGGIKAGINSFIYPKDNEPDFIKFKEECEDKEILEGINFKSVENIEEVLKIIFVE